MSCNNCDCMECRRNRAIVKANDVDDSEPHRYLTWRTAELANENQAKAWTEIINGLLEVNPVINLPNLIAMVCGEVQVRPENYDSLSMQIERFIRESLMPTWSLRKVGGGGMFKTESQTSNMKAIEALDFVDRKQRAADIQKTIASKEAVALAAKVESWAHQAPEDNYTCQCGNKKLNKDVDTSCWSCGTAIKQ